MMTGFTFFRAFGFAWAILTGTTGATGRPFSTPVGQAKTDEQYNQQEQWRDIALHVLIVDPQSP